MDPWSVLIGSAIGAWLVLSGGCALPKLGVVIFLFARAQGHLPVRPWSVESWAAHPRVDEPQLGSGVHRGIFGGRKRCGKLGAVSTL
jgi:hypothetical protein